MNVSRRALERESKDFFSDYHEKFWEVLRTRPYCRAVAGYANCLFKLGQYAEALQAYRDLLIVNKEDNTGSRHVMASILLHYKNYASMEGLFQEYPPKYCHWYTFALMKFLTNQPFDEAMNKSFENNIYVPLLLLNLAHFPATEIPLPNTVHVKISIRLG